MASEGLGISGSGEHGGSRVELQILEVTEHRWESGSRRNKTVQHAKQGKKRLWEEGTLRKSEELGQRATLKHGIHLSPFQSLPPDHEGLWGRGQTCIRSVPPLRVDSRRCLWSDRRKGLPSSFFPSFSRFGGVWEH